MSKPELPHPGRLVRRQCLEPFSISVADAARALGITRQALNNLVNGKAGISPEMAIRLAKVFGGSAEAWLQVQLAYDLALARKRSRAIKVHPISASARVDPQVRL